MKKYILLSILIVSALASSLSAATEYKPFSFGVIGHAFKAAPDESRLRDAIAQTDADNLAFVVANGIKSSNEPCSDRLYNRRKAILNGAKNGLILSLAASDWASCKRENGKSAAIERLNLLRELFFSEKYSFGDSKIPVIRQSITPKFRSYGENARWKFGELLFATINLPADNNHYLSDAGRNNEFEDRLIANREWLQRLFIFASRKKLDAIVLFSDGNPIFTPSAASLAKLSGKRDGFVEIRREITALTAKFPGKVLIIHNQHASKDTTFNNIAWRKNLGVLELGADWIKISVDPSSPSLFQIDGNHAADKNAGQ